jgi:replicative DNA helicase
MATTKLSDDAIKTLLAGGKKAADMAVSLDEVDSFGNNESIREMFGDIAKYNQMLKERITFINTSLTAAIPFTRENLYLICAYTGNGKSTVAANISYPLWKQSKKILVITNEESKQDVLFRIACLELGLNFNDYKKGQMPLDQQKQVVSLFPAIGQYVKVLDIGFKNGLTTKLEGIKNALDAVRNQDYSCAMIDYYQLIQYSVEDKTRSRYDVLNDLRIWLGQYIKTSNLPIVLFAQLHSLGKRNNKDLDSRIKECPSIQEPSTVVLEVIPNFEDSTSEFVIHKDRFGLAGHRVMCGFQRGRYVNLTDEVKRELAEKKLDELQAATGVEEEPEDEQVN